METIKSGRKKQNNSGLSILIASLALVATIISLYWTRVQYINSSRPYVWANNTIGTDPTTKSIIPIPSFISCLVLNSPARILQINVKITLDKTELFSYTKINFVRYPSEKVEWNTEIRIDEFNKIMNRSPSEKAKLKRIISIDYSSINGGKTYHYKLEQSFTPDLNQWDGINEEAD